MRPLLARQPEDVPNDNQGTHTMPSRRAFFLQVLGVICAPMLPKSVKAAAASPLQTEEPRRIVNLGRIDVSQCHFSPSGHGFIAIAREIEAKEAIWRTELGVPRGFEIPEKPIPASRAEREAEHAIARELETSAFQASLALPPGPERQSQVVAMLALRDRRTRLMVALRDDLT